MTPVLRSQFVQLGGLSPVRQKMTTDDSTPAIRPTNAVGQPWTRTTLAIFRFSVVFFGVTSAATLLQYLPGGAELFAAWSRAGDTIGTWVIVALGLPVRGPARGVEPLQPFLFLVLLALVGVTVAVVWSFIDSRARSSDRAYAWLHALIRFALAGVMLDYGWAKIFPGQFGYGVGLSEITKPVGDLTMQRLLWVFMAASRPYVMFGGAMEVAGALLLCARRTATAGALILIGVLTNVVILNFTYDVNVRVYSATLLLMAVFVASRDFPRLARVVMGRQVGERQDLPPLFVPRSWNRFAQAGAVVLALVLVYRTGMPALRTFQRYHPAVVQVPRPALDGIFEVEEFKRTDLPDSLRWTRVAFVPEGVGAWVRYAANIDAPYRVQRNEATRGVVLTTAFPQPESLDLTYSVPDSAHVVVQGKVGADSLSMRLRRVDLATFRLLERRPFWRW